MRASEAPRGRPSRPGTGWTGRKRAKRPRRSGQGRGAEARGRDPRRAGREDLVRPRPGPRRSPGRGEEPQDQASKLNRAKMLPREKPRERSSPISPDALVDRGSACWPRPCSQAVSRMTRLTDRARCCTKCTESMRCSTTWRRALISVPGRASPIWGHDVLDGAACAQGGHLHQVGLGRAGRPGPGPRAGPEGHVVVVAARGSPGPRDHGHGPAGEVRREPGAAPRRSAAAGPRRTWSGATG
jgi:hypothetical protein